MADITKETWENSSPGQAVVLQYDRFGNEQSKLVRSGQKVQITSDERVLNQERAANVDLDLFKNGVMVPVRLLEGSEDAAEIASNPNLKSEDDLKALFKLHWKTFQKEISSITNVPALVRLWEVAEECDATVKQVGVIESRVKDLDPTALLSASDDIESFGEPTDKLGAATPR